MWLLRRVFVFTSVALSLFSPPLLGVRWLDRTLSLSDNLLRFNQDGTPKKFGRTHYSRKALFDDVCRRANKLLHDTALKDNHDFRAGYDHTLAALGEKINNNADDELIAELRAAAEYARVVLGANAPLDRPVDFSRPRRGIAAACEEFIARSVAAPAVVPPAQPPMSAQGLRAVPVAVEPAAPAVISFPGQCIFDHAAPAQAAQPEPKRKNLLSGDFVGSLKTLGGLFAVIGVVFGLEALYNKEQSLIVKGAGKIKAFLSGLWRSAEAELPLKQKNVYRISRELPPLEECLSRARKILRREAGF